MSVGARCSGGSARQEVDRGPGDACIHRCTLMCKKCPVLRFANRIPCLGVICVIGMVAQCEGAGWTDATMSVMTGSTSVFPAPSGTGNIKVPDSLKVRYKQPEAYHPKLRFWFTPDVFEELNAADGTAVASWRNIANICHPAHSSAECTASKKLSGENMAAEVLKQSSAGSQPTYQKSVINNRGAVRFARSAVDGTAGDFLQMETTAGSGAAGFSTNPFAANAFTFFLVARTRPGITDTGQQGILNLAKVASDTTNDGLSIYKDSVVCLDSGGEPGLGCSGTTCTRCGASQYTAFGALSAQFGESSVADDNSCSSSCAAGCSLASPLSACKTLWGPASSQNFQDPDEWRIIALQADGTFLKGYLDGYHASSVPPISVTAAAAATIAQLRLGVVDQADETNSGFGNVDIAEIMIYDAALTQQEMDRIGNYLSLKFGLSAFRVNADVGSVTRTAAVSKNCGCSGGPPWISCDTTKGPYCGVGVPLASGSCQSLDQSLQVITGNSYLDLNSGANAKSPASGGNYISIKGQFVLPSDVDCNVASGIFGTSTADYSTLDSSISDLDTTITSRYLAVAIGHVPYACRAAYSTVKCLASDFIESFASDCKISMKPSSGTVDGNSVCNQWVAPSPVPEINCLAPPGLGGGQDLIIYWHGVATVLSNWFHYEKPLIESLVPSHISYKGGTITVKGLHFGAQASYKEKTQTTVDTYKVEVLVLSRRQLKCRSTKWVSDRELICETPPMPQSRAEIDTNAKTAKVFVVVEVMGTRSMQSAVSTLTYTDVPAFYACDNDRVTSKSAQRECFKCCRAACIVDEFANGAKKAGYTYTFCDKSCYTYCGYFSGRAGMHLSFASAFFGMMMSFVALIVDDSHGLFSEGGLQETEGILKERQAGQDRPALLEQPSSFAALSFFAGIAITAAALFTLRHRRRREGEGGREEGERERERGSGVQREAVSWAF